MLANLRTPEVGLLLLGMPRPLNPVRPRMVSQRSGAKCSGAAKNK